MASDENALFRTVRAVYRSVSPLLDWLGTLSDVAKHEIEYGPAVDVPLARRVWLWRHGFTSRADVLHDFSRWDPSAFVTSWEFQRTQRINRPWGYVVENKLSFHHLMGQFPDHRPTVFGMIDGGRVKPVDVASSGEVGGPSSDGVEGASPGEVAGASPGEGEAASSEGMEWRSHGEVAGASLDDGTVGEWVSSLLRERGSLVLKPVHGFGGDGVYVCEWREWSPVLDGEVVTADEFAAFVSGLDEYLVTEAVQQAEYAERVFPDATNTIRVYTMYDEEAAEPFVPAASHRFGTAASAPVDNFSRNGLAALIDVDTGRLGPGAWLSGPSELRRRATHPDTGERIEGTTVPDWSTVVDRILEMASAFSQAPFLGWDVVLDEDRELYVLEANASPGITTVQMHRPLKTDPRVAAFLKRHGV